MWDVVEHLAKLEGSKLHVGLKPSWRTKLHEAHSFRLPPDYEATLNCTNGIEAYFGYIRLFGIFDSDAIDSLTWNRTNVWKFAWGNRAKDYWCFAETAWGDQYAFSSVSLEACGLSEVFMLDALTMKTRLAFSSFSEFMEKEFLKSSSDRVDLLLAC